MNLNRASAIHDIRRASSVWVRARLSDSDVAVVQVSKKAAVAALLHADRIEYEVRGGVVEIGVVSPHEPKARRGGADTDVVRGPQAD